MTVILQIASAMMEPIGLLGYLLCGLLLPRLWMALGGALGWAVLMNLWETAQEKARYAVSGSELMVSRFAAAALAAAAVYYALSVWRERRSAQQQGNYYPPQFQPMLRPMPMVVEEEDDRQPIEPRQ